MNKNRIKFLKLLKKYGTMTAPEICQKLKIKKSTVYSTDYSELLQYANMFNGDEEFESYFNVRHYEDDLETSCRSEFSITKEGEKYLKSIAIEKRELSNYKWTIFSAIIGLLAISVTIFIWLVSGEDFLVWVRNFWVN